MKRFRTQRTIHCTFLRTIVTTSFLSKSFWTSSSHSGAKFKYPRKIHISVQSHDFSLDVRRLLKFCCLIWLRFDLSWGNYRYSSFFLVSFYEKRNNIHRNRVGKIGSNVVRSFCVYVQTKLNCKTFCTSKAWLLLLLLLSLFLLCSFFKCVIFAPLLVTGCSRIFL